MKTHPILFSTPMVQALLEGRKTMTRRVVKPQPKVVHALYPDASIETERIFRTGDQRIHCPYGKPGDLLWVRETFAPMCRQADPFCWCEDPDNTPEETAKLKSENHYIEYKADTGNSCPGDWPPENKNDEGCPRWKPSIHMPRWASRLTLRITDVRVERVQEISEEDVFSEGVQIPVSESGHYCLRITGQYPPGDYRVAPVISEFASLWDSINAKRGYGWKANPWVWVISFEVLEKKVDEVLRASA